MIYKKKVCLIIRKLNNEIQFLFKADKIENLFFIAKKKQTKKTLP